VPGRFKDYIASPKFNLYQSLHSTVWGPVGRSVEVQVRTRDMHRMAEFGIAAHYAYKQGSQPDGVGELAWMQRLLGGDSTPTDYVEAVTVDLQRREIYCLTPQGRIIELPEGSTPVDFAYSVHTQIGDRAAGARVDGKLVGLDFKLSGGERVEIIVSKDPNRGPNPSWAAWVATARAKALIRRWHTRARRTETAVVGMELIEAALIARAKLFSVERPTGDLDGQLFEVMHRWGVNDPSTLAAAVGEGKISAEAVATRLLPTPKTHSSASVKGERPTAVAVGTVFIEGDAGIEYTLASCCNPTPPGPIVGWVSRGRGISVHQQSCTNVADLVSRDAARILAASWVRDERPAVAAMVEVEAFDFDGLLAVCASALTAAGVHIVTVATKSHAGLAELKFGIEAGGTTALDEVLSNLSAVDSVVSVQITET
jgi:GTP pyrophosphokinase